MLLLRRGRRSNLILINRRLIEELLWSLGVGGDFGGMCLDYVGGVG